MKKMMLTVAAAGIGLALTSFAAEQQPPGEGAQLLEQRCSTCHASSRVKNAQKTVEGWEATVTRMMSKGAKLSDTEKKTLVDYLAATYAPKP